MAADTATAAPAKTTARPARKTEAAIPKQAAKRTAPAKAATPAAPKEKKISVSFTFERSTKGTHVFQEDADGRENETVGKIYVRKSVIGDKAPAGITIEITVHA